MEVLKILKKLYKQKKITKQQYSTYKGQAFHGDEIGCITELKRKHLISDAKADALILNVKLAYTE